MANAEEMSEELEHREAEDFANAVKKNGVSEISNELRRRLNSWKRIPLNIGIIGTTGVGKSTFINALRRLKPTSPGGAATDVVQKTVEPTPYEHPQNPSVKLWDLPGVGTAEFPRRSYLELIRFEKYEFFIIISCARFTEDDLWFAREIRQAKKRFYFVRTKVDTDITSDREDYPKTHCKEALLRKIKGNCSAELVKAGFVAPLVFLICKNPLLYDFPDLEEKLITDLPELKQEAALLTLNTASKSVVQQKTRQLHKRSWLVAAASGAVALVPVPGLSIMVDSAIMIGELKFYKKVYGLDDEGLKQLSESLDVPKADLISTIKQNFWMDLTSNSLLRAMGVFGLGMTIEEGSKYIPIPIIGLVVSGALSFAITKLFLRSTILSMEKAALAVLSKAFLAASAKKQ